MSYGIIFDIKEFAVHDGPGIRTTVFFKGCPLQCEWCHNPEGISFKKELMVNESLCRGCGRCEDVCENEICTICGRCVEVCPLRIRKIVGEEINAKDLANTLLEDKDLYEENNGGVTVSGGEPLAQPEFLFDLLKELKEINVAIDTSGYVPSDIFEKANELANLILFDIKHLNPDIHKKVTGVDNSLILKNLDILCNNNTSFYIRIPLIPGINDDKSHMEDIAKLIKNARGLCRVELLTYQKTAGAKYSQLGKKYAPSFNENKEPEVFKEVFLKQDINVSVFN